MWEGARTVRGLAVAWNCIKEKKKRTKGGAARSWTELEWSFPTDHEAMSALTCVPITIAALAR